MTTQRCNRESRRRPRHSSLIKAIITTISIGTIGIGTLAINYLPSHNLEQHLKKPAHEMPEPITYNDNLSFVAQYNSEITTSANNCPNYVPIELIIAAILRENEHRPLREDIKDWVALTWNDYVASNVSPNLFIDVSLGPGQVNVSTAQYLDNVYNSGDGTNNNNDSDDSKSRYSFTETERRLLDPALNINYTARYLHFLSYRENRSRESETPENIMGDSHLLSVIGAEYVIGPRKTALSVANGGELGELFLKCYYELPTVLLNLYYPERKSVEESPFATVTVGE